MTTTLSAEKFSTTDDGVRLRVHEEGSPDAPVTLVLVHGWTLACRTWDRVVPAVTAAADVRVLRFDLRGHGESDPAPDGSATIERCADDLAGLIRERVPEGPVVLAGHSMGGMTIMALAERHRQLFDARVGAAALVATSGGDLVAPTLGLPGPVAELANRGERLVRGRLAAARGRRISRSSRLMRPGLRWMLFGRRPNRQDVADSAQWFADCHPASTAGFRESLARHERLGALEALRAVPVVVLSGAADRLTPLAHSRRIARELPDARLVVYPGAGHMLPLERTDEVAARIAELVAAAAPSAAR